MRRRHRRAVAALTRERDQRHRGQRRRHAPQVYASAGNTTDSFDPTASGTISGDSINFNSAPGLATGTPVIYESDPKGKPIGGLVNGKTYYVISNTGAPGQLAANAPNPDSIQLAATAADAFNDVPIKLDGERGRRHQPRAPSPAA